MLVTNLDRGLEGPRPKHSHWLSIGDFPFLFGFPMYAVLAAQSCPTLYNVMECSSPNSSVHGILQARILEWVAIPFSRGFPQPRNRTQVSCIAADSLPFEPPGKLQQITYLHALKFTQAQEFDTGSVLICLR